MISFDEIKTLDNLTNTDKNNCVIHSNLIIGTNYLKNIDNDYRNCIGIRSGIIKNYRYKAIELLNECSNFGKNLYDLYKNNFKLYKPETIELDSETIEIDGKSYEIDSEIIEFVSLMKKGLPYIKDNKATELISIFIDWFNSYGFPITPKIVGIEENIILEFSDLLNLRNQFLILYLFYSFYTDLNFVCYEYYTTYATSQKKEYSLTSSIRNINNLGSLIFDNFSKLENDFYKQDYLKKQNYFENIRKRLLLKINYYTNIFNIKIQRHLVYTEKECKEIYISDNLFDLAWNTFLDILKYNEKICNIKKCIDCGSSYISNGNNSKRCPKCSEKYNNSKESQNKKNEIIDYIIEISKKIKISNLDKDLQNRINEIISLNNKRKSRDKYTYSKKEIHKVKQLLEIELKKSGLI